MIRGNFLLKIFNSVLISLVLQNQLVWPYPSCPHTLRPPASAKTTVFKALGRFSPGGSASALFALSPPQSHEVKKELNRLKADYGFLAQEHRVVRYIGKLLSELYPDLKEKDLPRIEVLASKGYGVNSMVFPNNTIVVTPELLAFVQHKEEILFVLCHEMVHMDREHFSKIEDLEKRNSIRALFGLLRYQELEADIIPIHILEERDINPYGAISLMQRLKRKGVSWGPVHGTETDRLLNIETITYLKDIRGLSYMLAELPEWLFGEVDGILKIEGRRIKQVVSISKGRSDIERRCRQARAADAYLIQQAIPELYNKVKEAAGKLREFRRKESDITSTTAVNLDDDRKVLFMLAKRGLEVIDELTGTRTEQDSRILNFMLTSLVFGGPLLADEFKELKISIFNNIQRDFHKVLMEDFQAALKAVRKYLFDEDIIERFGLTITSGTNLQDFIRYIFCYGTEYLAYETEGRFDFKQYLSDATEFINAAIGYTEKAGVEDFKVKELWTDVVFRGILMLFDLSQEKNLTDYLKMVKGHPFEINDRYLEHLIRKRSDIINEEITRGQLFRAGYRYFKPRRKEPEEDRVHQLATLLSENYKNIRNEGSWEEKVGDYTFFEIARALKVIETTQPLIATDFFNLWLTSIKHNLPEGKIAGPVPGETGREKIISIIYLILLFSIDNTMYKNELSDFLVYCTDEKAPAEFKGLSYPDLEQIYRAAQDISAAKKFFNLNMPFSEVKIKLEDNLGFKLLFFNTLYRKLKEADNPESFFSELDRFLNRWPFLEYEGIAAVTDTAIQCSFVHKFEEIAGKGVDYIGAEVILSREYDAETLKRLFILSFFSKDIFVRNTVQEYLSIPLLEDLSFEEALSFVESAYTPQPRTGFMRGWEYLIEEKAQTPAQMEILTDKVQKIFKLEEMDALEYIGTAVGVEGFMEKLFKRPQGLLSMLLETSNNDSRLKNFLFKIWWPFFRTGPQLDNIYKISPPKLEQWSSARPIDELGWIEAAWYFPLEDVLNSFYRMDYKARYILLRRLLTGKRGALNTAGGRQSLLNEFMRNFISFEEDETYIRGIIEDVLGELIEVADDDQLYFSLYPLLIDRIANPPQSPTPWKEIEEFGEVKELEYLDGEIAEYTNEIEWLRKWFAGPKNHRKALIEQKKKESKKIRKLRSSVAKKILTWIYGYDHTRVKQEDLVDNLLLSVVPEESRRKNGSRLSAIGLILEVAQRLGTPGVRFLQLLGQFVDLPEEYQSEFMDVYDSMVGQSRLSAYQTLKRECPDFVKRIRRFGKRVGGGALMTVYEVELDDGTKRVAKVRNPNAEYFSRQSMDLLRKVLTGLSEKNKRYNQALPLLDDLEEWIYLDLHDDKFIDNDQIFRRENKGYRPKGFSYEILVPETEESHSLLVIIEESVEGRNFTELRPIGQCGAEERLRQKEKLSLIARNYFDQIFRGGFSRIVKIVEMAIGDKTSLVHADIHPGNFRDVAAQTKEAILDRSAYIELNKADRKLLYDISQCRTNLKRLRVFMDYLSKEPENEGLSDKAEDIIKDILTRMRKTTSDLESIVMDIVIRLKGHGVKIPLKITRLIKNLNGLKRMAKKYGGFTSLKESLEFDPRKAAVEAGSSASRLGARQRLIRDILSSA